MKKSILVLFTIFIVAFLAAETVVLVPSDDMYTDAEHPGTAPLITELWTADYSPAGHFERIMIKFDLSEYISGNLTSANLHLTRHFSCPSSGTTAVNFYLITETWDENSWQYTQHASYDPSTAQPFVFTGAGSEAITDFEIDLTNLVNQWISEEVSNNGLVIIAQSNQKFSQFYSKEFSNESYRPALTLELSDSAALADVIAPTFDSHNYPNPFNPITNISYNLPTAGSVSVEIFNCKGQRINTLLTNAYQTAGDHHIVWQGNSSNGTPVSSGIYHYIIKTADKSSLGSMQLIK